MFSISGLMATTSTVKHRRIVRPCNSTIKAKKKKINTKAVKHPTVCVGIGLRLQERSDSLNPYGYSCSMRCRHPMHTNKNHRTSSQGKTEDWIPEDLYKRYTETDSRPISPDNFSRRSVSAPRGLSLSYDHRKCLTPEPDAKQCQFHQRRVLILDLRRVKSVDVITRQNSLTTGTSVDSTYGDDDCDNRSSSANLDSSSIFHQFSPRNLSMSRSTTPKARLKGRKKKSKERSSSPVTYERSSSPKILEGGTNNDIIRFFEYNCKIRAAHRAIFNRKPPRRKSW